MPNLTTAPQNLVLAGVSFLTTPAAFDALPDSAWLRESQLVRSCKSPASAVAPLPFSAPTLWRMVKAGKFPKPTKLSARVTAWQVGQVRAWMTTKTVA
jgi:predicted DNA-binding transcriptional regulator AlpA